MFESKRPTSRFPAVSALFISISVLLGCNRATGPILSKEPIRVLLFSKTAGFRHESIPAEIDALRRVSGDRGFLIEATEDTGVFTDSGLSRYKSVVFLNTTGDVLSVPEQEAFERFVQAGGGFVGVHSATDTEYEWAWYGELVGTYFKNHPAVQQATVKVADPTHPSMTGLPENWIRIDEWYNFRSNPRGKVHVLAVLDEATYVGGEHGADHPIVWCREYLGGRSWYTGGGHTAESFTEPLFLDHLSGGILWSTGVESGDCAVP